MADPPDKGAHCERITTKVLTDERDLARAMKYPLAPGQYLHLVRFLSHLT